jgi:hypothetical protein
MKTRYLAESLSLPDNWSAERYSTTIELMRDKQPGECNQLRTRIVLPYGALDVDLLSADAAEAIAIAEGNT